MVKYPQRWFCDLNGIIASARGSNGEQVPGNARALLQYFCQCVEADNASNFDQHVKADSDPDFYQRMEASSVPDVRVMKYLAVAFRGFLKQDENGDMEKELGLKRRKAGNPGSSAQRHKRSARMTPDAKEELRQEVIQMLRNKETHAAIKKKLSVMCCTSQDTVRSVIREVEKSDATEGSEL